MFSSDNDKIFRRYISFIMQTYCSFNTVILHENVPQILFKGFLQEEAFLYSQSALGVKIVVYYVMYAKIFTMR